MSLNYSGTNLLSRRSSVLNACYHWRVCSHSSFHLFQNNRECSYGDKCYFYHDVAEYLANKPADIGESCYLYDTFGKCQYGLTCRFAKAHTTPDFKTMQNADLLKAYEGRTVLKNSLSKDLQYRLRKHSVPFKKSDEYIKTLSNYIDKREQQGNGKTEEVVHQSDNL